VNSEKRQVDDWKPSTKYHTTGPARFIQESDKHDIRKGPYKRVTREEAEAGAECRIYADGVYDMFHAGHAKQLMQAKNAFPNVILIVGIPGDKITHQKKGKTVLTDEERYESLRHCRYVDIVLDEGPWNFSKEFFDEYKIDFFAHDDLPYTIGIEGNATDLFELPRRLGMFIATERSKGISTSGLITRIVKDHEMFVRRNLKRGIDRKELNVGSLFTARLLMMDNIQWGFERVCQAIGYVPVLE